MDKEIKIRQLTLFDEVEYTEAERGRSQKVTKEYDEFVEKFAAKHTTDDCFTPPYVYEAVVKWCRENLGVPEDARIVRPFCPGGDFEHFDYPDGCYVIDNPPFSIFTKILRTYQERGIMFFLFGPHLTISGADIPGVCYVIAGHTVTYANGAKVCTSFATNMADGLRFWVTPDLYYKIAEADAKTRAVKSFAKLVYPACVINSALAGKIAKRAELKIREDECEFVRTLSGRQIFGGAYLLSSSATAAATNVPYTQVLELTFEQLKSYNRLYAKRVLNWSKSVCDLFGQLNRTA